MQRAHNTQADSIKALYPDHRESGETQLRQCQLVMIRMLKIFDHICQKHRIPYWLSDGTLLGAVRHQGFIPWDGDIDVGMLREDFNRFAAVAQDELPDDMFLQTPETDPLGKSIPQFKLRDRYSCYTEWALKNPQYKWHHGLMVDIWICDPEPVRSMAVLKNLHASFKRKLGAAFGKPLGFAYVLSYDDIFPLQYFWFESQRFPALKCYQDYLRFHYGDYLNPPPAAERFPHEGAADAFTPCDHPASLIWTAGGAYAQSKIRRSRQ